MTDRYNVEDVFTPTTPARLTFVERESINNKLVNALKTPGKQIVIYGHSGSGKTTLLENKLHQIYENHITSRCVRGTTFEQLTLDAFDQMAPFYDSEYSASKKREAATSIGVEYGFIKAQLGSSISVDDQRKMQRILPPQLTPQSLARFIGEAKCCWVIEDFHKVQDSEKVKLAQVMKVFMDMADTYRELKIIALGAVHTARQIVESDAEMRNRVSEIYVALMEKSEIEEIILKGEELLNLTIKQHIKNKIINYSNGIASVCHQLCLNICFSAGINQTPNYNLSIDNDVFQTALNDYVSDMSDTIKSAFDKAFKVRRTGKYDNAKLILESLASFEQEGATYATLYSTIKKIVPSYPASNLTYTLQQLQTEDRGNILFLDSASGKYFFSDPAYRVFAMISLKKGDTVRLSDISTIDLLAMIDSMLVDFREKSRSRRNSPTAIPNED